MKIIGLKAENIKKLKAVQITPDGNVVKISGRNEQGKTSLLDSIWYALGGAKAIPEKPIRQGEKSASVTLNLGDIIVTRSFTEANSYLKVENKDGAAFKSPQAMLDKLIGELSFDPLAFAKADPKKQVDMLLKVVDLQLDHAKLQEIAGVPVPKAGNPLQVIKDVYGTIYTQRTAVNRQLDQAKKVLASRPEVEPAEPVSVSELVAERDQLIKVNEENDRKRREYEKEVKSVLASEQRIAGIQDDIERLREQLKQKENQLSEEKEALKFRSEAIKDLREVVEVLVDNDLTDINNRIAKADETNRQARQYQDQVREQARVDALKAEADSMTARLEAINSFKQELVGSTRFPVDGLDFGDNGVIYNGIPFSQVSSAQKLQVSMSVAMALNPKLRVIRIDDGSLLDSKHMAVIEQMAKDNDFQVWIELVDESGKVGIYLEDGEVKTSEGGEVNG